MTTRGLGARMMLDKLKFIRGRDVEWKKAFGKVDAYIDKHVSRVLESQKSVANNGEEDESTAQKHYTLERNGKGNAGSGGFTLSAFLLLAATTGQTLSFEILKSMKYLRYVFNESLRLHTTTGFLRRVHHKHTILPLGGGPDGKAPFLVRKGSNIACDIHALHRDKSYWGNDVDDFRPER
ncbi:hypothetical protein EAF00_010094 [Botryotinia globosa]|nr:hypothetical protein EAF00_010094 [Botryotinia globosa]